METVTYKQYQEERNDFFKKHDAKSKAKKWGCTSPTKICKIDVAVWDDGVWVETTEEIQRDVESDIEVDDEVDNVLRNVFVNIWKTEYWNSENKIKKCFYTVW